MCNSFAHDEDKDPTENYAKCLLGCDIQSKYKQKQRTYWNRLITEEGSMIEKVEPKIKLEIETSHGTSVQVSYYPPIRQGSLHNTKRRSFAKMSFDGHNH